jgi:hypothetical protein
LNLKYDILVSKFAFKFNVLYLYTKAEEVAVGLCTLNQVDQ